MRRNLLLLLISLPVALLVAEAAVRLAYRPPPATMATFNLRQSSYYRPDDELGHVPNPNIKGVHKRSGSFSSFFSTNSVGLRDSEYAFEKPEGVSRIVVVGDSFAWGFGVNDGEIFTDVLEDLLPNVEVINLGVTAFGLRQEIEYYERLGVRFDPDILIVAFVQNDVYSAREGAPRGPPADNRVASMERESNVALGGVRRFVGEHVRLYGLAGDALKSSRTLVQLYADVGFMELKGFDELDRNVMPALKEYPDPLSGAWERVEEHLVALNETTSDNGVRLVVALVPALQSVEESQLEKTLKASAYWLQDFDVDKPYEAMGALGRREGFDVINPLGRFRDSLTAGRQLYLRHDSHFNPQGHAVFAEAIAEYLLDSDERESACHDDCGSR